MKRIDTRRCNDAQVVESLALEEEDKKNFFK
jgi:hypothetical protein